MNCLERLSDPFSPSAPSWNQTFEDWLQDEVKRLRELEVYHRLGLVVCIEPSADDRTPRYRSWHIEKEEKPLHHEAPRKEETMGEEVQQNQVPEVVPRGGKNG